MTHVQHFVSRIKKRQRWDVQTMWACDFDLWPVADAGRRPSSVYQVWPFEHEVASKVGNLNLGTLGLWVRELFAMHATDGQTDRWVGRMDKSNAYCPLPYGNSFCGHWGKICLVLTFRFHIADLLKWTVLMVQGRLGVVQDLETEMENWKVTATRNTRNVEASSRNFRQTLWGRGSFNILQWASQFIIIIINFYYLRQIIVGGGYRWFAAQRYYVHKTSFRENRKDTKVVCPVMWTYDICAFDTGTYCDYYFTMM